MHDANDRNLRKPMTIQCESLQEAPRALVRRRPLAAALGADAVWLLRLCRPSEFHMDIRGFPYMGYPQIIHLNGNFPSKPSSYWGTSFFGKPPYGYRL